MLRLTNHRSISCISIRSQSNVEISQSPQLKISIRSQSDVEINQSPQLKISIRSQSDVEINQSLQRVIFDVISDASLISPYFFVYF